ncbi:fructose-bisphosphate aldolase, partial [Candidatus Woesearchaeota archaeon]|nr:fructose-bisphosphate aldolase [Candidatus Woesearchaeota archaeon]
MNETMMKETVLKLMAAGKGILAIDESTSTCTKRFQEVGLE